MQEDISYIIRNPVYKLAHSKSFLSDDRPKYIKGSTLEEELLDYIGVAEYRPKIAIFWDSALSLLATYLGYTFWASEISYKYKLSYPFYFISEKYFGITSFKIIAVDSQTEGVVGDSVSYTLSYSDSMLFAPRFLLAGTYSQNTYGEMLVTTQSVGFDNYKHCLFDLIKYMYNNDGSCDCLPLAATSFIETNALIYN